MQQILELVAADYQRHSIHTQERDWAETNCYVDVWIEVLHALGHEPLAAMPFTFGIDFEGDQWTFFKFPLNDIFNLYGIEVQELAPWKPLATHIEEQVELGRMVLVELDSMYLPDTAGTAYKMAHVKTTVAVNAIDIENQTLGYFHAQGYYNLQGEDFVNVLRLNEPLGSAMMPPYIEIAKLGKSKKLSNSELTQASLSLFKQQLNMLPLENPFDAFKIQLEKDLTWLREQDIDMFHQYSFATLRQLGACFELSASYLNWLSQQGESDLEDISEQFKKISEMAKVYQFQLARVISRGKALDINTLDTMAELWHSAMRSLKQKYAE